MDPGCPRDSRPMIPDVASDLRGPGQRSLDGLRVDPVDDDELLATRRAGHDPDVAPGDAELVGDEPDQGVVGGALDGRGADPGAQDPVHDAIDAVSRRPRRETDGEADVGGDSRPQKARHRKPRTIRTTNPDQSIIPLCGSIRRTGREDRLGGLEQEGRDPVAARAGRPTT